MNTDKKLSSTQLNVRVSVEDQTRFQTLCDKKECKQSEGFTFLLDTLALQQAAEKDKTRHENLTALKHHTQAILNLFTGNYAIMDTIKDSVREEFIADLSRQGEIELVKAQLINKQTQLKAELEEVHTTLMESERNCVAFQKELEIKQEQIAVLEKRLEKQVVTPISSRHSARRTAAI